MGRVGTALIAHELGERARDRWVVIVTALFTLLAVSIGLYGGTTPDSAVAVTGPSLVTLSSFLVPLVALVLGHDAVVGERERNTWGLLLTLPVGRGEVLLAKYLGRLCALAISIGAGLGSVALLTGGAHAQTLLWLVPRTLGLGACFLSVGVLISVMTHRLSTAASLAVVTWFVFVFLYDLGILGALVLSDGAITPEAVGWLVNLNPAGLYRTMHLAQLSGQSTWTELGVAIQVPSPALTIAIVGGWVILPLAAGSLALKTRRTVR